MTQENIKNLCDRYGIDSLLLSAATEMSVNSLQSLSTEFDKLIELAAIGTAVSLEAVDRGRIGVNRDPRCCNLVKIHNTIYDEHHGKDFSADEVFSELEVIASMTSHNVSDEWFYDRIQERLAEHFGLSRCSHLITDAVSQLMRVEEDS